MLVGELLDAFQRSARFGAAWIVINDDHEVLP